jgi:hypothetical protein
MANAPAPANAAAGVHVFFPEAPRAINSAARGDAKSTAYIIHQNNVLHSMHATTKLELSQKCAELDQLEADNDSLQKTRTCIQGYVRNEASKFEISSENNRVNTEYYFKMCYVLLTTLVTLFATAIASADVPTGLFTAFNGIYIVRCLYYAYVRNKDAARKLAKINQSCDYLHELVDNI